MPAGHLGKPLGRGDVADRDLELVDDAHHSGWARHLTGDPLGGSRVTQSACWDKHAVGDSGVDRHAGFLDRHPVAGSPTDRCGREGQVSETQVADEILGDEFRGAARDDTVNVSGLQSCVPDRSQAGFQVELEDGPVCATNVFGVPDSGYCAHIPKAHGADLVNIG